MNRHCVYGHYLKENDELFYIGSGTNSRANSRFKRTKHWEDYAKNGWYLKIIVNNITKEEALFIETILTLINFHNGKCKANRRAGNKWLKPEFNSMYGKPGLKGSKSKLYKSGKPKCEICDKQLSKYNAKRCRQHVIVSRKGTANGMYGKTPWNKGMRNGASKSNKA